MQAVLRRLSFAFANTAAVLAALYIAFARDLERPYWAMFTVFIVANPISGAVRSKGAYRLLGTLAGAAISLLLIPPLVHSPLLLCLATACWVGLCLYLSLLDRTPRSYIFLLSGYTATLVGLAVVNQPETIFDTSVARVEEISLGILCAAIAHSVFFPRNALQELNETITTTFVRFSNWLSVAVTRAEQPEDTLAHEQLARIVTELHLLYTHVAFETSDVPRAGGIMRTLQDRLARLLPALSAVQKAFAALQAQSSVPAPIVKALEGVADWARRVAATSRGCPEEPELRAVVGSTSADRPEPDPSIDWQVLLERALTSRLTELMATLADCQILARALKHPEIALPPHLERETASPGRGLLHRDRGLALLSAFAAAAATLVACGLWIEGSWPEGGVAAQFAAIGCALSATLDNPTKLLRASVVGILIALPIAAVYEFAIIPQIDGFASLALVLAPVLLLFSLMQASPRLGGAGLVVAIAFSGGLALQSTYRADFAAFVNSSAAEVAGLLVAVVTNLIFRTVDPAWNALRISKDGWRSVSALASGQKTDMRRFVIQMFDRLGLVTSRLKERDLGGRVARWDIDGLRDLRVGLNVAVLRGVSQKLEPRTAGILDNALQAVSRLYHARLRGGAERTEVERSIDLGITTLGCEPRSRHALEALTALTGLRLDLAPAGTQYRPPQAAS